jgi:predicted negative regulator of RcsB-dependent stress response
MAKHRRPDLHKPKKPESAEEQEDVFVANVLDLSSWLERNRQLMTLAVVALVIIVAGGMYYVNFQRTVRIQAVNQLESIQQTVSMQAFEDAKIQLGNFLDRFAATPQAGEAAILLARLHLEAGDAAVAINVLENQGTAFGDVLGIQADLLLAKAYEEEGRWPDAERMFLRVADEAEMDFQVREGLENAARARMRQRNVAGAAELYQRILDTYEEGDPDRGMYELRLAEVMEIAT